MPSLTAGTSHWADGRPRSRFNLGRNQPHDPPQPMLHIDISDASADEIAAVQAAMWHGGDPANNHLLQRLAVRAEEA
jgi:hypothetical protein